MINNLTPYIVNFYQGMGLLTKKDEKQFPQERGILAIESSKGTEEEDNVRTEVPSQQIVHKPVQVDVLPTRERLEKRLAKRWKVIADDEEDRIME